MLSAKTVIIGGASALVLGGLVLGTQFTSYVRTAGNEVRETVEDAIPIEFQLKRAKDMLENELEPEIRKMKHAVAESQVEVEQLQAKLEERQGQLTKQRNELMAQNDRLKGTKNGSFLINNVSYTRAEVEEDVTKRLSRVQTLEKTFKTEAKVVEAKERAVVQNESKVEKLLEAREELKLQIEELEARVSALKAAQTVNESEFDDSKLAMVKDLLDGLEAKVTVGERELAIEDQQTTDLIPVETEETHENVTDAVDAYFGNSAPFGDTASVESESTDE